MLTLREYLTYTDVFNGIRKGKGLVVKYLNWIS